MIAHCTFPQVEHPLNLAVHGTLKPLQLDSVASHCCTLLNRTVVCAVLLRVKYCKEISSVNLCSSKDTLGLAEHQEESTVIRRALSISSPKYSHTASLCVFAL